MNRLLHFGSHAVPIFGLMLAALLWIDIHGFTSQAVMNMSARAIVQVEGPQLFRTTETFYPPLPYITGLALQVLVPWSGVPLPSLLSAAVGALLILAWFGNLRECGAYNTASAILIVALLAINPLFLRALADGPGTMFLLLGVWIYVRGLLNLRLNGTAPDMMKVSVGLLIMSLSHAHGLLLALGALPFIVVAARPSMLAASSLGYIVSIFFPVVAAVASLIFIGAVLDADLLPVRAISVSAPANPHALLPTLCSLLVVAAALIRTVRMPRFAMPILAAAGSLIGGAMLSIGYGFDEDPTILAAPALGLVIVAMRAWPPGALRAPVITALLLLSLPLSLWSIHTVGAGESLRLLQAARGVPVNDLFAADRAAAEFLEGKRNILVDVERNPGLVAAMGDVDSLLVAGQSAYDITVQGGRVRGEWIAIRYDPDAISQQDRLLRAYPQLAKGSAPPFALHFSEPPWLIFKIIEQD